MAYGFKWTRRHTKTRTLNPVLIAMKTTSTCMTKRRQHGKR